MVDVVSKRVRSRIMAAVRSEGNDSTELRLVALLRRHRLTGWRTKQPLFGKPDFVYRKHRVVLFVDGCFWHGCPLCYRRPASRRAYWDAKAPRNRERDRLVMRTLRAQGWRVLRIWEHKLIQRNQARLARRIAALLG